MTAPHSGSRLFRFSVFEVDFESGELRKQGRRIVLHEQPFQALILLLEHPGEVVTREQLRLRLWPVDTFVEFDKNLNTTISKVREVLGDSAVHPRFIETLPRRGYRFVAPVEEVLATKQPEAEPPIARLAGDQTGSVPPADQPAAPKGGADRRWFGTLRAGYFLAALAAVAILGWAIYLVRPVAPSPRSLPSLAVLPFSYAGSPEQEYLADTLPDELIHTLARIDALNVVARTSSFKFKGKNEDVRLVGKALGVGTILEGSVVRTMNGRLRTTIRLVSTTDGFQMWSETYDREFADISSFQQDVAEAVVSALKVKLAAGPVQRFSPRYSDNVEAQTLYLQARHIGERRTREGFTMSIQYFQKCVALDPRFALAYSEMADSYASMGAFYFLRPSEVMPRAKDAVLKALQLQPELGRAHSVLGYIRWAYDRAWDEAEGEFKRAISAGPGEASAHLSYGAFLLQQHRYKESLPELRRAEQLDPLSPLTVDLIGGWFLDQGDFARALEYQQRALELEPGFHMAYGGLAHIYLARSQPEEAIAALQKGISLSDRDPVFVAALASVYAQTGNKPQAEHLLKEVLASPLPPPVEVADIYANLGDLNRAFNWLDVAYRERQGNLIWIRPVANEAYGMLRPLRSDPRWIDLLKRLNLKP
jgi:TolB-like protein/DNA-binding winged helix-turn-helix (wHTH) protein